MYDYGDEWAHVLKLEKVDPEPCLHPRVLAGKYEAPQEDSGGGYEGRLAPLDLDLLNGDLTEWAAVLGQATQDKDE